MKQSEKLEIENNRADGSPESLWTINLFREGAFYRMYQRSAWIKVLAFPMEQKNLMECLMFIRELKEDIAQKLTEPKAS